MRIHTGERNYKCEICSRGFITNQNLSKHMKTHTKRPNAFLKCKETCERGPLGKFPCTDNIENGLIKEETYVKRGNLELDYDTIERTPPTDSYTCHNDAEITEEKLNLTEILDLRQGFTSEIIIKEEENHPM